MDLESFRVDRGPLLEVTKTLSIKTEDNLIVPRCK